MLTSLLSFEKILIEYYIQCSRVTAIIKLKAKLFIIFKIFPAKTTD